MLEHVNPEYYKDDPVFKVMISQSNLENALATIKSFPPELWTAVHNTGEDFNVGSIVHLWVLEGLIGRGIVTEYLQDVASLDKFKIKLDILLSKPIPLKVLRPFYIRAHEQDSGELLDEEDSHTDYVALKAVQWAYFNKPYSAFC